MSNAVPTVLTDLIPMPRIMEKSVARDVTLVVGGALLTALCAQIVIHLGFTPVPITGQTFAVLAVGGVLGSRRAIASQALYWLLGAIGLPFYADSTGGWSHATGSTFGYFVGFVVAAGIVGWYADCRNDRNVVSSLSAMALGTAVIYFFGALWLAHSIGVPVATGDTNAITLGVAPFLAGDAVKLVLAALVSPLGWTLYYAKPR
ncbi:MAG: biotin transporter BioY [Ilumatobacteraceae bacterium]|jgi:biotin transport system substrate-specific component|nr:biotin transporter BioY [Ilumatobacteraceae bacterium]